MGSGNKKKRYKICTLVLGAGKKLSNIMAGGKWNFPSVLHSEYNLFWIDFPYGYVLSSFWCFKQYPLIEDCRHKGIAKSERLFRMWNCNIGEKMKYVSYKLSSTT